MRRLLVVLVGLLVLGGCGGEKPKEPSLAQYRRDAARVCREAQRKIEAVPSPHRDGEWPAWGHEIRRFSLAEATALSRLPVPVEFRFRAFTVPSSVRTRAEFAREFAQAVFYTPRRLPRLRLRLRKANDAVRDAAFMAGVPTCRRELRPSPVAHG